MAEENKTLLTFGGDASGAKAAAQEVVAANAQVEASVQRLNAMTARARGSRGADEIDPTTGANLTRQRNESAAMAAAAGQAADQRAAREIAANRSIEESVNRLDAKYKELYGFARATGDSPSQALAFAQKRQTEDVLGGVGGDAGAAALDDFGKKAEAAALKSRALSQVLGAINPELGMMARLVKDVGELGGAIFTPMAAAIAAVVAVVMALGEAWGDAFTKAKSFYEQQQRIRDMGVDRQTTVEKELAKAGKAGDAAVNTARNITKKAEEAGLDRSAAAQVAAAVVDQQGKVAVDEAEFNQLVAGVQTGAVSLGGDTKRERESNLRNARRKISRDPESFANAVDSLARGRRELLERATQGNVAALTQLGKEQGLSDEEAAKAAKAKSTEIIEGAIGYESTGTPHGDLWKIFKQYAADTTGQQSEQRERQAAADRLTIPESARPAGARTSGSATQPAAQPAPVTIINNHRHFNAPMNVRLGSGRPARRGEGR